jgi:hypothetical protein
MEVVSALFSCDVVGVMAGGWEHPLPAPFFTCVGVLSVQSVGQTDATQALPQVLLMLALTAWKCRRSGSFAAVGSIV